MSSGNTVLTSEKLEDWSRLCAISASGKPWDMSAVMACVHGTWMEEHLDFVVMASEAMPVLLSEVQRLRAIVEGDANLQKAESFDREAGWFASLLGVTHICPKIRKTCDPVETDAKECTACWRKMAKKAVSE